MKILVTGGLGFVGIHLVRVLAENGARVVAADLSEPANRSRAFLEPVADRVTFKTLDVRDRAAFENMVCGENVDTIIHAAAVTPDSITEKSRLETILDTNLLGALNAILAASRLDFVKKLILCSSSGLYGSSPRPGEVVQHEGDPLELDSLYAITKYSAELLGGRCAALSGKLIVSVRLASIYGEMEFPSPSRETMSHIGRLCQFLSSEKTIRTAGKAIERDWMYAQDLGEAVWALLEAPVLHHPVYNIGTGRAISFEKIIAAFSRRGLQCAWVSDPAEADIAMRLDQARAPMDISRLMEDAHYTFTHDPLVRLEGYLDMLFSGKAN